MSSDNTTKNVGFLSSPPTSSRSKSKNFLLAIGINNYRHCPRLYNAVKDAKEIVKVLLDRFQFQEAHIKELYDEDATKQNIINAFKHFARQVTSADNFVIYFSGHGEYEALFKIGYWIPVEADIDKVEQFIPNSLIKDILSAIDTHHTFLMVDSCFSGVLFNQGVERNVSRKERDPSRWALTSGRHEIVRDGKIGTNSPFADSILYQLRNASQSIGVAELSDKVLEIVTASEDQTPRGEPLRLTGHKGGQFVFHLKEKPKADSPKIKNSPSIEKRRAVATVEKERSGKKISTSTSFWQKTGIVTILIAGIIVIAVMQFSDNPIASKTVTVIVKAKNNIELPSKGTVLLNYGMALINREINNFNQAVFTEVPSGYFEKGNKVKIAFKDPLGEPYYAMHEDSTYQLEPNQSIEILVSLRGLDKLYGVVKEVQEDGLVNYIEGASVKVLSMETFTDKNGRWKLNITKEYQKKFQTVEVSKKGFQTWTEHNIPASNDQEIVSILKPIIIHN